MLVRHWTRGRSYWRKRRMATRGKRKRTRLLKEPSLTREVRTKASER